jgi:hypothetical protein
VIHQSSLVPGDDPGCNTQRRSGFKGASHRIVDAWLTDQPFELVICHGLLEEVRSVLIERRRFRKWVPLEAAELFVATLATTPISIQSAARTGPYSRSRRRLHDPPGAPTPHSGHRHATCHQLEATDLLDRHLEGSSRTWHATRWECSWFVPID